MRKKQDSDDDRPADSTTTTRDPITPAVTESTVTGLEEALEFYPNTFYKFTVTGTGTQSTDLQVTDPVAGDMQWHPVYWSTSSNPSSGQKNTTWQIGAKAGITEAETYIMYIFFQKYVYSGTAWQAESTIEYISVPFYSKALGSTAAPKLLVSQTTITIKKGKTDTIGATLTGGTDKITYKSSNSKVASVDKNGKIKAKKAGTAKITVKAGSLKKTVKVTVVKASAKVKKLKFKKSKLTVTAGTVQYLSWTVSPKKATTNLKWKSSNKNVVTVDQNGKITAKKAGTAKITVSADGKKATIKITVKAK